MSMNVGAVSVWVLYAYYCHRRRFYLVVWAAWRCPVIYCALLYISKIPHVYHFFWMYILGMVYRLFCLMWQGVQFWLNLNVTFNLTSLLIWQSSNYGSLFFGCFVPIVKHKGSATIGSLMSVKGCSMASSWWAEICGRAWVCIFSTYISTMSIFYLWLIQKIKLDQRFWKQCSECKFNVLSRIDTVKVV